ncbi:tandem-95 repeat protein [Persicimonas caeni]|uniref:Tandem-95 repeat protein n=1 Tax=Persicimonas caeni TaxID=2292766 RepID=A0A4Y6PWF9_PERCE|nr:Ig-like domain-containing protein [Persicimonas caeni]QDG52672.1 tandem-95 repeat protein [Persicimonas caeni]QED33894.1 tandem-95 repeat protein [Persicimonas caeni]
MDISDCCRSSLCALFATFALTSLFAAGCEPEFNDRQCQSDQDCFADEVCAVDGICQPQDFFPDVGEDGGTGDDAGPQEIVSVQLSPATADLAIGGSLQLEATALDADGNPVSTALFEWRSSDPDIADVDGRGIVTGELLGTVTVSARSVQNPEIEGFAEITVVEGEVASVEVAPNPSTLFVGETATFQATAFSEEGSPIPEPFVVWSVEDEQVATVNSSGVVTALAEGTTNLVANVEGITGSAEIEVIPVPVDRIEITPQDPSVTVGGTVQLRAKVFDVAANELTDRTPTWTSSNTGVATVDASGLVSAQSAGTSTITAEVGAVSADVTVTVVEGNAPPSANDHTVTTDEDTSVDIDLNGSDADNDPLTFAIQSGPTNGSLGTLETSTGQVTYTPDPNYSGSDTFTFTVDDGQATSSPATVDITVREVNDGPTATDDTLTTDEDTPATADVLANDTDPEGDNLSVSITTSPSNGTASVTSAGEISYTPDADFNGSDSLAYTLSDGNGGTAMATLSIQVTAINDAPVAADDTAGTNENQSVNVAVLQNDDDVDGDTLSVTGTTTSAQGVTVTVESDNSVTYQPPTDYVGTDSFDYTISDGTATATATVTVTVNNVNDAPTAADDTATTDEDTAVTIDVLANDGDPDNDPLGIISATTPSQGSTSVANGQITYTPNADENGTDTFEYTISDGNLTATATVTVTITPVDDPPTATDDTASTTEDVAVTVDVLQNDSDIDTSALTIASVTTPTQGAASIDDGGTPNDPSDDTVTYTPDPDTNGSDTFDYTVSDGTSTDTGTVSVTITAVNDSPQAVDDTATAAVSATITIDLTSNDTDVDGDTLSVSSLDTTNTDGTVTDNGDGTVEYTAPGTAGTDTFTYVVSDGNGGSSTGTVTVTVQ